MLFNKCERPNRLQIEDSNKDKLSEQLDHKCTYNIQKMNLQIYLQ